jgi:tight adherence protein B
LPAYLFPFLVFLAAALAVFGIYSFMTDLVLRDRSRLGRRVDEEFRKKQRERVQRQSLFKNLSQVAAEAAVYEKPDLRRSFVLMIEQAGLDMTPERVLGLSVAAGLLFGGLAGLLRDSILVGVLVGLLAAAVPFAFVYYKRQLRLNKLQAQLPAAFDLMGRVIRAGQTMIQALQAVADDFDKPVSAEFSYCFEQQNLGLPPEVALRDLARRTGLLEIKIFVLALLVQQQTGGNLAELLDKLAGVMRERFRIKNKIRALTAEGRFQALILLALPPLMLLIMLMLNPTYTQLLLDHPRLLAGMFVAEGLGAVWIRQIVNFDF